MIDSEGFRANVGIILSNGADKLFWARRVGQSSWQFPQGGINADETPLEAAFRELKEEVGLGPEHVEVVAETRDWLRYRLPKRFMRRNTAQQCVGQKQKWFLLKMLPGAERAVHFDAGDVPEFDDWRWIDYWEPVREVIFFKRDVYRKALKEMAPTVFPDGAPPFPWKEVRHPYLRGRMIGLNRRDGGDGRQSGRRGNDHDQQHHRRDQDDDNRGNRW